MIENTVAFYPGETSLFSGEISLTKEEDDSCEVTRIRLAGDSMGDVAMSSTVVHPLRQEFLGYPLKTTEYSPAQINVDLELDPQPTKEEIARALIAAIRA